LGGCQSDEDCPAGQICSGGQCADSPTCSSDSQCEMGQVCVAGACVAGCRSNRDCPSGWTCLPQTGPNGTCAECQVDGDCGPGRACADLRCVFYCTSDAHCTPLFCDQASHQCVACTADAHCAEGEICEALACQVGCRQDADCASGHCNTQTHTCAQCVGNDDCPLGSLCFAEQCVTGCQGNRDCPAGLQCDPNLGDHGTCVECLVDGDCQPTYQCVTGLCEFHCQADSDCQPPRPACEQASGVCVACTTNDHCAVGTICLGSACVPGCQSDRDCPAGSLCAANLGDNGACVACLVDGDCPASYTCDANQCIIQGSEMVRLPGGGFVRGSDPGEGEPDEEPEKTVLLPTFYIDRTEVTNDQYRACVQSGACTVPSDASAYNDPAKGAHPVVFVQWQQASDFCAWMGKGLPSEARWERAARGTGDERIYPWGDSAPDCSRANYSGCTGATRPVGSLPGGASPGGVLDMAGNASEWVYDRYLDTYYTDSTLDDPWGPLEGDYRVVRGGGYDSLTSNIRVANRAYRDPTLGYADVGFRCSLRGSPTADFLVTPEAGPYASTTFSVDAATSSDPNHPVDVLEVRWDWEADDSYDTTWTTAKTASHRYAYHGVFRIRLELRDPDGNTDTASFEVVAEGQTGWDGATCASDQECAHGFRCVLDWSVFDYVCREACIWLIEPECHFGAQTCKLTIDPVGNACMP
jgi:Cys-rich repeat protein